MGFYGNVTNTSKTTFSFDLIYTTRSDMDLNANLDGVFLGRYVLVDYGEDPIKGYYNAETQAFYNTALFSASSIITGRHNAIYQDLHNALAANSFYKYTREDGFQPISTNSAYQERFAIDVKSYGRGYDSTVWVKRYDEATGAYKYVMIAELNAVVPTFHMVVNEPNAIPTTPYFDRDTTNIDYYLHMQSEFGNRVKKAHPGVKSDEQATRIMTKWVTDNSGYQFGETYSETVDADIYYNNAGFDHAVRHFMDESVVPYTWTDDKGAVLEHKVIDYTKNAIGYEMGQSGRLYGADADLGVYQQGHQADDIYDWYIRLPGIGNAICRMWDKIYDNRGNNTTRALNKAQYRDDIDDHLVSYNKDTLIGMMNTAQDLIGYHFVELNDRTPDTISDPEKTVSVHIEPGNDVASYSVTYKALECLYWKRLDNGVLQYYHYAYQPYYTGVTPEQVAEDKLNRTFYYAETIEREDEEEPYRIFHVANSGLSLAKDADGNHIAPTEYWLRNDQWALLPLEYQIDDNIYSLIRGLHKLIGTNSEDVRDINTIYGSINIIKDIIANIDTELVPGRLLHTRNDGVIDTTDTYFPSATWDRDEVLAGDGQWVSRFSTIQVRDNSDNANRKIPKVVEFEDTDAASDAAPVRLKHPQEKGTLVSDNQKYNDGTQLKNSKRHEANTLVLATRDKWIKLHPDDADDSIEFEHTQSPLVEQLSFEPLNQPGNTQAIAGPAVDVNSTVNTENFVAIDDGKAVVIKPSIQSDNTVATLVYDSGLVDRNDNRLTIPYITVDNAGHVIAASTKNYNIPHSFKKIYTSAVPDTNESPSLDQEGVSIADNLADSIELTTRNRWIDIATEANNDAEGKQADSISFSHRLAPAFSPNKELNGERRTQATEIPSVYRYGLEADKTVAVLDQQNGLEPANTFNVPYIEIDKAGHVVAAETHTVHLPENFTTVTIAAQNESTKQEADTVTANSVITADNLTDNITFKTMNRWIGLGATDNSNNDIITVGHRLSDIKDVTPLALNGERRANEKYEEVYRYGLPQDKSIAVLNKQNGVEAQNTFNVPYVEIDEAGHVVHAETHIVTLPENYTTITVSKASEDDSTGASTTGTAGNTSDDFAKKATLVANNLTESLDFSAGNKWIRLAGTDTDGADQIVISHELHSIIGSTSKEDLDAADSVPAADKPDKFVTQTVQWDKAGHIISHDTKEWTLPNSIRNIEVVGTTTVKTNPDSNTTGTVEADVTSDTVTFKSSNIWTRLQTYDNMISFGHLVRPIDTTPVVTSDLNKSGTFTTEELTWDEAGHITKKTTRTLTLPYNYKTITVTGLSDSTKAITTNNGSSVASNQVDEVVFVPGNKWVELAAKDDEITFAHSLQGTAGSYGTNVTFSKFGGTVDLQGYQTDNAGHVIAYPTYTLTLPQGSYKDTPGARQVASVITEVGLNAESGAISTKSQNVGTLLLTGYSVQNLDTATVVASDTLNAAIQKLETQVYTEKQAREQAITNLRMFKTITVGDTALTADSNADTLAITAGNNAIVLTPTESSDTFSIGHKTYTTKSNKLYKITVDEWGHVSGTAAATSADVGLGNVENKSVADIVAEITSRFSMKLNAPQLGGTTNGATFTVLINNMDAQSTYEYKWTKQGNAAVLGTSSSYTATDTEVGTHTYTCTVTRSYGGAVSDAVTRTYAYTIEPPPVVENPETGEGTV